MSPVGELVTSEGALLALIVDDDHALLVLAAWAALDLRIADAQADATIAQLSAIAGVQPLNVRACVARLLAARVLRDGGISDIADRLLQSRVQARLTAPRRKSGG